MFYQEEAFRQKGNTLSIPPALPLCGRLHVVSGCISSLGATNDSGSGTCVLDIIKLMIRYLGVFSFAGSDFRSLECLSAAMFVSK